MELEQIFYGWIQTNFDGSCALIHGFLSGIMRETCCTTIIVNSTLLNLWERGSYLLKISMVSFMNDLLIYSGDNLLFYSGSELSTTPSTPTSTSRRPSSSSDSPLTTPVTSLIPMTSPRPITFTWRWTQTSFSNFINSLKQFRSNWMRLSDQNMTSLNYSETPL